MQATMFWTSLENKPISAVSGMHQKRRGVRSGLSGARDVSPRQQHHCGLHRAEVASRRWERSTEANPSGNAADRREVADGAARRGTQAMARASACARGRDVGGGARRCRGMCTAMDGYRLNRTLLYADHKSLIALDLFNRVLTTFPI